MKWTIELWEYKQRTHELWRKSVKVLVEANTVNGCVTSVMHKILLVMPVWPTLRNDDLVRDVRQLT